jgi:GNAT superfamily N-acetyltransferase
VDLRPASPRSADAGRLMDAYMCLLESRVAGWHRDRYHYTGADALEPPTGRFLIGYEGDEAVACGGVTVIAPGVAEVRRMYVAPAARGRGLGRALLQALEATAVELGCRAARLDTIEALAEAVALYRSFGYADIGDYNRNPNATLWLERRLDQPPG